MDQEASTKIEVLLIGNWKVGKSRLIWSLVDGKTCDRIHFSNSTMFSCRQMKLGENTVHMTIWDTAEQEHFGHVPPNYYRDVQGAIFVYDVTDRNTFVGLENWFKHLEIYRKSTNRVKIIVGNKIDLPKRKVSTAEGLKFAEKHEALYTECSAITSDGVEGCFEKLVREILQPARPWRKYSTEKFDSAVGEAAIRLGNDQAQKDSSTCCNSN